ncbi:MAG: histidine kinase dimerization/phosphoacceptor domain-containing protein [Pseudonocardia sp.]|nr:histidine kinase dimerization/phosphoacceptor domain-containing protein [Pseudonocardia sp.]
MRLEPAPAAPVGPEAPVDPEARVRAARRLREQEQWRSRLRLERQLHDGAALRISALALQLGLFQHRVPAGEPELRDAVGTLQDELAAALQELRDVAAQIYPPLLDEAGLGPALRNLVERLDLAVRITAVPDRFGAAAEGAVYFALADALSVNAGPLPTEVRVTREAADLVVVVDGGGAVLGELLRDRAHPLGGAVDGPAVPAAAAAPGVGTIVVRIPCE